MKYTLFFFCFCISYAQSGYDSPLGFTPADITTPGYQENSFYDANNIGVQWHRPRYFAYWFIIQPDLKENTYIFNGAVNYDKLFSSVPDSINIVANIAHDLENANGRMMFKSYLPIDSIKYINFVKATVERYDGDGLNDMPGLTNPIKYWQVDNEPKNTEITKVYTDFNSYHKMTYNAIKDACPDCKVLIGGSGFTVNQYIDLFEKRYSPILEALNGKSVDIMDFHMFGNATTDYRMIIKIYEKVRAVLDKNNFLSIPIWATEIGTYSGKPDGGPPWLYQTEQQQAADMFKRVVISLAMGVNKVFSAFGLIEGFYPEGDNSYFDNTGFIYNGHGNFDKGLGIKKLVYFTYKLLAQKLKGINLQSFIIYNTGNDFTFLCSFLKNKKRTYIAWYDYFLDSDYSRNGSTQITLKNIYSSQVQVTDVVPTQNLFKSFSLDTITADGSSVKIQLSKNPVFIEEILPTLSPPLKPKIN